MKTPDESLKITTKPNQIDDGRVKLIERKLKMTTIEKSKFLFTFVTNNKGKMSSSSILYDSFDKAVAKMNSEADRLSIYSGTIMTKKIGINKFRANVVIKSKYVDVVLQVAPLAKQDNDVISTNGWDYDYDGIALI